MLLWRNLHVAKIFIMHGHKASYYEASLTFNDLTCIMELGEVPPSSAALAELLKSNGVVEMSEPSACLETLTLQMFLLKWALRMKFME